ncbi:MAG: hypothetical protein EA397_16655 [Deltaproteobacteria bacterium]|nr:MAG: hypothetical protein EA397_16655 [Deltaproteobacteria bacterium]
MAFRLRLHATSPTRPRTRLGRRGNYATIFGLLIFVIIGFAALALDIAYMRMAQLQAQDSADAASQAALIVYRRTGDEAEAEDVAGRLLTLNRVAGEVPDLGEITFGTWDQPTGAVGMFQPGSLTPNAVRVQVARTAPHLLAPAIGFYEFDAIGRSTSATRNLHIILSVDITNSWSPDNFANARVASELFLQVLADGAGPYDRVGMNVWTGRYAWEFTPMFNVRNTSARNQAQAEWSQLRTASKPGLPHGPAHAPRCNINGAHSNNAFFENPPPGLDRGGCYPNMPREYMGNNNQNCTRGSECGTDHTVGLEMSRRMFSAEADDAAFRALVVLTDGIPNTLEQTHGEARRNAGFEEDRWNEYLAPVPHAVESIRTESVAISQNLWDDMRVHTWVVSFDAHEAFMPNMVQGQGYYEHTNDSATLVAIFEDIVNSLPLALVE